MPVIYSRASQRSLVGVLAALALVIVIFASLALWEPLSMAFAPDLTGTWRDDGDWGNVVLRRSGEGAFEGTYSSTYGRDVGRIRISWQPGSRRYAGTWGEATYRFGRLSFCVEDGGRAVLGTSDAFDPERSPGCQK